MVYKNEFSVYKVDAKGSLVFFKIIDEEVLEGYFWEKLFFFLTSKSLFIMTAFSEVVVVELASRNIKDTGFRLEFDIFQPEYVDSLEGALIHLPFGQLKILSIVNLYIYFIDNHNQVCVLPIVNPYVRFCMEVITQCFEVARKLYENVDPKLISYFDDVLKVYACTASQLKA